MGQQKSREPQASGNSALSLGAELQALAQSDGEKQFARGVAALLAKSGKASTFVFQVKNEQLNYLANQIQNPMPPGLVETEEVKKFLISAASKPEPSVFSIGHFGLVLWAVGMDSKDQIGVALFCKAGGSKNFSVPGRVISAVPLLRLSYGQWKLNQDLKDHREGLDQACLFLDLIYQSSGAPTFRRGIQTLAEELRNFIGCENLAIGLGRSLDCKLEAFSSASKFDQKSQTVSDANRRLREAVAVGNPIGWPADSLPVDSAVEAASDQVELTSSFKVQTVTAHPLKTREGNTLGAWICFWKTPPSAHRLQLAEAMSPHLASTVDLIRMAKPRGIRGVIQRNLVEAQWAKLAVPLVVIAVMIGAMFLPFSHKVSGACWIDPTVRRQVAAPFDGILEKPFVEPGDFVKSGDLVAQLDGKEIAWQLADLNSRLASLEKKKTQALASDSINETQLIELEMKSLSVERDHLIYQQKNLEVRSPIDGMVLTGDLEQSEGVPVQRGQRLFDISPIEDLTAMVAIPGNEVKSVEPGMEIRVRLESETEFQHTGILESIEPVSSIHEGKNVFLGRVRFENPEGRLRPGMRGRAQIVSVKRKLGWILFHRPYEYFRLHRPW